MPLIYCPIRISIKRKFLLFMLSLLAGIFRFILTSRKCKSQAVVIEPFGMGDAISILPLVNGLCTCFNRVGVITKKQWSPIFHEMQKAEVFGINLPWSDYSTAKKYSLSHWIKEDWRSINFALKPFANGAIGFDPRGDIRSILFLYYIGCSKVYTLDHYLGTDAKIPRWAAKTRPINQNQERWKIACDLLAAGGYANSHANPPSIHNTRSIRTTPRSVQKIAFMPIAPWQGRLWPSARWQKLYSLISSEGFKVHGICGPDQTLQTQEILGIEEINACTTIDSWIKNLSEIDLLITLDSGPMHLADALDVPLIALFGPGQIPMWSPTGKFARVLSHQESPQFRPIHQIEGNKYLGNEWMEKITTEEVWNCFLTLITDLTSPTPTARDLDPFDA